MEKTAPDIEKDRLPLFDTPVSCGFPSPAQDYVTQRISLDQTLIRYPESTYLLHASGDSMIDAGIADGDLLIVESYHQARHGDIVVVALDNEFTCKRLQLHPTPMLMPANPACTPIPLSEDIETILFGIVRHVIHSF